jgi:hypothetical protein
MSMGGYLQSHKKLSVIIVVLLLIAAASVAGGVYWYPTMVKKYQQAQEQKFASQLVIKTPDQMPAGMPVQSFYDYDTSVYKAMFTVVSVDAKAKTMKLKFIYPFRLKDNVVTSRVDCALKDTFNYLNQTGDLVPATKTVYEETGIVPGQTTMQAKCDDRYCRQITTYCELWL